MPLSRTALLIGASVVALCGVPAAAWHRMIDQSFNAPFAKFDASGKRDLATFRHDGDTVLNEHFVRLTADRLAETPKVASGPLVVSGPADVRRRPKPLVPSGPRARARRKPQPVQLVLSSKARARGCRLVHAAFRCRDVAVPSEILTG